MGKKLKRRKNECERQRKNKIKKIERGKKLSENGLKIKIQRYDMAKKRRKKREAKNN